MKSNKNKRVWRELLLISASWLIIIALVLIIMLLLGRCGSDDNAKKDFSISSEEIDYSGEQNKPKQAEQEYIEVPYYGTLYVSEDEPYVWFNNPDINNVYFSYEVLVGEEELFHNEDYISPGKAIKADVYSVLDKGEHEITIHISSIDQNGNKCNGATQNAVIVVQ